jgi:hypothetical protein
MSRADPGRKCCAAWDVAVEGGSDSEGWSALIAYGPYGYYAGCLVDRAISFCPWCGIPITTETPAIDAATIERRKTRLISLSAAFDAGYRDAGRGDSRSRPAEGGDVYDAGYDEGSREADKEPPK